MAYEIEFDPDALKDPKKLERPDQQPLVGFLKHRVAAFENPRDLGEPLAGARPGNYWKYRVGNWRIICDIPDRRIVVRVLRIGDRREVYR
ncbi:MAG TPA: type II toxin-antitoxin system RelE/ParE family toxin [Rhodocyclaceae bacterium]|nr:type II toxin-antitoxin system RelE/ParE family toxin [Rhodocyclaceae bacterium]